jgi:hypothetical protein
LASLGLGGVGGDIIAAPITSSLTERLLLKL